MAEQAIEELVDSLRRDNPIVIDFANREMTANSEVLSNPEKFKDYNQRAYRLAGALFEHELGPEYRGLYVGGTSYQQVRLFEEGWAAANVPELSERFQHAEPKEVQPDSIDVVMLFPNYPGEEQDIMGLFSQAVRVLRKDGILVLDTPIGDEAYAVGLKPEYAAIYSKIQSSYLNQFSRMADLFGIEGLNQIDLRTVKKGPSGTELNAETLFFYRNLGEAKEEPIMKRLKKAKHKLKDRNVTLHGPIIDQLKKEGAEKALNRRIRRTLKKPKK